MKQIEKEIQQLNKSDIKEVIAQLSVSELYDLVGDKLFELELERELRLQSCVKAFRIECDHKDEFGHWALEPDDKYDNEDDYMYCVLCEKIGIKEELMGK